MATEIVQFRKRQIVDLFGGGVGVKLSRRDVALGLGLKESPYLSGLLVDLVVDGVLVQSVDYVLTGRGWRLGYVYTLVADEWGQS